MRLLFLGCATCVLVGCGAAANFADMQSHSAAVTEALEKEFGAKPEVSWNVFNGDLQRVEVVFDVDKLAGLNVADLEAKVRAVVVADFGRKPSLLIVGVRSQ